MFCNLCFIKYIFFYDIITVYINIIMYKEIIKCSTINEKNCLYSKYDALYFLLLLFRTFTHRRNKYHDIITCYYNYHHRQHVARGAETIILFPIRSRCSDDGRHI